MHLPVGFAKTVELNFNGKLAVRQLFGSVNFKLSTFIKTKDDEFENDILCKARAEGTIKIRSEIQLPEFVNKNWHYAIEIELCFSPDEEISGKKVTR